MLELPFVILLIVAGLGAGLLNAADRFAREGSRLEILIRFLGTIRIPFGMAALVISLLNAFNVWVGDYPLLTWIVVFLNSLVLLDQFLIEKLNIGPGPVLTALEFLKKYELFLGIAAVITVILKTIYMLTPFWEILL